MFLSFVFRSLCFHLNGTVRVRHPGELKTWWCSNRRLDALCTVHHVQGGNTVSRWIVDRLPAAFTIETKISDNISQTFPSGFGYFFSLNSCITGADETGSDVSVNEFMSQLCPAGIASSLLSCSDRAGIPERFDAGINISHSVIHYMQLHKSYLSNSMQGKDYK